MIITELCHELNNWFVKTKYIGQFTISGSVITFEENNTLDLRDNQYFRIIGSIFNDGVHLNPATDLVDEKFDGALWTMAIPQEFLLLVKDIEDWQAKYGGIDGVAMSPFASESFGGYSYTKSGGRSSNGGDSDTGTWQGMFASRLNKWRKIR